MADLEFLKQLRAAGVKSADLNVHNEITRVEFFPRELLDFNSILPSSDDSAPTDRPPASGHEAAVKIPPAMKRILGKGSVS